MILLRAVAIALILAGTGCRAEPQATPAQPVAEAKGQTGLAVVPLRIRSANGSHDFQVEVAASEDEQQMGLMFREQLAPDRGMIFPFPSPRPASFWMKNTVIPLDMLFIRADGTIAYIAPQTKPLSLEPVGVGEPVAAVLELAGGRAAELGIQEGDHVSWSAGTAG